MAGTPYPGYPPNYSVVDKTGGYNRTCIVIELQSLGEIERPALATIQEQVEAIVEKLSRQMPYIENTDVVLSERFDKLLRDGLRLP